MDILPFSASFDALAFIVKQVRDVAADPEVDDLVPALFFSLNSCSFDEAGRVLENISYEHYGIGWYKPQDITDAVEVDIWGRKVFVHNGTLKRLVGKQLVLRSVDSGGRSKAGGESQLIIAVDLK